MTALAIMIFLAFMALVTAVIYGRITWMSATDRIEGIAALDAAQFGRDEIADLVKNFGTMESALTRQMADISEMTAEREKTRAELSIATRIQMSMIPTDFSGMPCDINGSMTPAREVGGDFYDFFRLDDGRVALVMADVSGKGVPAAMFMTISRTLIRQRAAQGGTPAKMLEDVNTQLCMTNREMLFVTVWLGIADLQTGRVAYCNAGHEYPVVLNGNGAEILEARPNDPPLGLSEDIELTDRELMLGEHDGLFIYTDGLPEAKDAAGDRYGMERLIQLLKHVGRDADCASVVNTVRNDYISFLQDIEPFDDMTMLLIRR